MIAATADAPAWLRRSDQAVTWARTMLSPRRAAWLRAFHAVVSGVVRAFGPDVLVTQHGTDSQLPCSPPSGSGTSPPGPTRLAACDHSVQMMFNFVVISLVARRSSELSTSV